MWWIPCTFAAEVGLSLGVQHTVNDPFVVTIGPTAAVEVRPVDWLGVGLAGNVNPRLGRSGTGDWTPLTKTLESELHVAPDLSRIAESAALRAVVTPLRGTLGTLTTRVGVEAGVGVVRTLDDLEAIRAAGVEEYEATADQVHPAGLFGLVGEVRSGSWGARLLVERMSYTETVGGVTEENKDPVWVAVQATWWTGARRPAAPADAPR